MPTQRRLWLLLGFFLLTIRPSIKTAQASDESPTHDSGSYREEPAPNPGPCEGELSPITAALIAQLEKTSWSTPVADLCFYSRAELRRIANRTHDLGLQAKAVYVMGPYASSRSKRASSEQEGAWEERLRRIARTEISELRRAKKKIFKPWPFLLLMAFGEHEDKIFLERGHFPPRADHLRRQAQMAIQARWLGQAYAWVDAADEDPFHNELLESLENAQRFSYFLKDWGPWMTQADYDHVFEIVRESESDEDILLGHSNMQAQDLWNLFALAFYENQQANQLKDEYTPYIAAHNRDYLRGVIEELKACAEGEKAHHDLSAKVELLGPSLGTIARYADRADLPFLLKLRNVLRSKDSCMPQLALHPSLQEALRLRGVKP